VKGRTLADFPEVLSLWDHEKNGPSISLRKNSSAPRQVAAKDVPAGSVAKVHWKCQIGPDHEWYDAVTNRTRSVNRCPFCTNRKASVTNSVQSLYPDIAMEWHPSKNGEMTASDCVHSSLTPRWWICPNGHEYRKSPEQRCKKNRNCKKCHSPTSGRNVSDFPKYAALWAYERNEKLPEECSAMSHTKYWWKCPVGDDHYWLASASQVSTGRNGCAVCDGKQVVPSTSLAGKFPNIAKEWHPRKNGDVLPDDVSWGSRKEVWWQCSLSHEWKDSVTHRTGSMKTGCPYCSGYRVSELNNITINAPELLDTWDWDRNSLTPDQVAVGSKKDIAWKCQKCNYEWKCPPGFRNNKHKPGGGDFTGCPMCAPLGFQRDKTAYYYVLELRNEYDDVLAYKGGITSNIERRLLQHKSRLNSSKHNNLDLFIKESKRFDNGKLAEDFEKLLLSFTIIRAPNMEGFSNELFLENPLNYARINGFLQ
jgi:hypothetical protein